MQLDFKEGKEHISKAILVGIVTRENSADEVEKELDELARLLDTAGGEEFARLVQNKETPDPRTVIGSGKIAELSELCKNNGIKLVIFDASARDNPAFSTANLYALSIVPILPAKNDLSGSFATPSSIITLFSGQILPK